MKLQYIFVLTVLNLLNYTDRFLISASLVQLKADFSLSDLQGGLLFTAFVLPYLIFSLLLAYRADRTNRFVILKIGTVVWSLAAVMTSFAQNFNQVLMCRSLLGVGEAAFATVAPAVVHQLFSAGSRGKVMAIFTSALPLGMALGFMGGGALADHHGWRAAFLWLGVPALIVSGLFLFVPSQPQAPGERINLGDELRSLLGNREYVLLVLGYAAYMFVAGGASHWMPTYITNFHHVSLSQANAIFGGTAIGFGLLGTLVGGAVGDRLERKRRFGYLKVSWISMLISFGPFVAMFYAGSVAELILWISLSQFFMFFSNSPITIATLQAATARQASFAMAVQIFVCHILGDALSAPWIGWMSDKTGSLRLGLLGAAPFILIAAFLWHRPQAHQKMA
jgi:predicted MFS family arabinose efflux permease